MEPRTFIIEPQTCRDYTNISDNISGKLLGASLWEAQDIQLQSIIGTKLYRTLLKYIDDGVITEPGYEIYKELQDTSGYFVMYSALSDICLRTAVKIDNAGLQQVTDERMSPLSIGDTYKIQDFYQRKADYYCGRLQDFINENKNKLPELRQNNAYDVQPNRTTSAQTGLWLGGVRCKNFKNKFEN